MDKLLLKFYTFLVICFIFIINTLPFLFVNINNLIDLINTKYKIYFYNQDISVNINSDNGNIIIMFDDGWKSQYDVAYKYMKSKDMRGSISIIASEVGNTKYVNMANIYEMYNSKWDILNHTYSHKLLPSMTYDDQKKEIENSIFWFKEKKLDNNLNILIYPEGMYNYNTLKVVKDLYIKSARSILDGYNTNIINNIYEIKVKDVKSFIEVSTVIGWINYAINNNITLILLFHDITNNTTSDMTYRTEDFYQIIDYIYSNNDKINIITYSDWIRAF